MIAVDFLCGLFAFFEHVGANMLDRRVQPWTSVALPQATLDGIRAELDLQRGPAIGEALAARLGASLHFEQT